jgi:hypothetical protein
MAWCNAEVHKFMGRRQPVARERNSSALVLSSRKRSYSVCVCTDKYFNFMAVHQCHFHFKSR